MPLHRKSLSGLSLWDPVYLSIYRVSFISSGQSSVFDLISFPSTLSLNTVSDSARGRIVRSHNQKISSVRGIYLPKEVSRLRDLFLEDFINGLPERQWWVLHLQILNWKKYYLLNLQISNSWSMSSSKTKEDDTLKQIHFLSFMKELQVRMLGGLKLFIPSFNRQQLSGSMVLDYCHNSIMNSFFS